MNDDLFAALSFAAALGSGLMAGLFFAFSVFVMRAFDRLSARRAVAAMQAINVAIPTPLFALAFFGTALVSAVLAVAAVLDWQGRGAGWALAGSLLYLSCAIAVTLVFNVPLNNALARVAADQGAAARGWAAYRPRWTAWNHLRTLGCLAATAAFVQALR